MYFYRLRMTKIKRIYTLTNKVAAIFMVFTLLWLTASMPFVYAAQQQKQSPVKSSQAANDLPDSEDSSCNPFGNTTEEKAESGPGSLSEYLHQTEDINPLPVVIPTHNCHHHFAIYVAFHGELLCPPPNFILS